MEASVRQLQGIGRSSATSPASTRSASPISANVHAPVKVESRSASGARPLARSPPSNDGISARNLATPVRTSSARSTPSSCSTPTAAAVGLVPLPAHRADLDEAAVLTPPRGDEACDFLRARQVAAQKLIAKADKEGVVGAARARLRRSGRSRRRRCEMSPGRPPPDRASQRGPRPARRAPHRPGPADRSKATKRNRQHWPAGPARNAGIPQPAGGGLARVRRALRDRAVRNRCNRGRSLLHVRRSHRRSSGAGAQTRYAVRGNLGQAQQSVGQPGGQARQVGFR